MLLLMGIFATFCGFIYNEFTSLGTMTFGETCYPKKDFEIAKESDFDKAKEIPGTYWAH